MTAPSIDPTALLGWIEAQMPVTLDLLRRLVEVNSYTANRAGVVANGRMIAEAFAPLGFQAQTIRSVVPMAGDHLFLERPAAMPEPPTFMLVSHLDTVYPPEEEQANDFHWQVDGDRAYGPGVNDIKGGTVMMWLLLLALQEFAPRTMENVRWVLAFDATEEDLSADFAEAARSRLGPKAAAVLVFEPAYPVDARATTLVTGRKGRMTARIECHGRGAHSGAAHAQGANALVELCGILSRLAEQTDYPAEVTWNPGVMRAGTVVNRVPHHAVGELEVRAFDPDRLTQARRLLEGLAGEGDIRAATDGYACRREVTIMESIPPWPGSEATRRLASRWEWAAERIGRRIQPGVRGGLSDANYLWQSQVPVLDGLGPAGLNAHCSQRSADGSVSCEWVDLSSFAPLAAIHTLAIAELASEAIGVEINDRR